MHGNVERNDKIHRFIGTFISGERGKRLSWGASKYCAMESWKARGLASGKTAKAEKTENVAD
jgi:hypothetical protein